MTDADSFSSSPHDASSFSAGLLMLMEAQKRRLAHPSQQEMVWMTVGENCSALVGRVSENSTVSAHFGEEVTAACSQTRFPLLVVGLSGDSVYP